MKENEEEVQSKTRGSEPAPGSVKNGAEGTEIRRDNTLAFAVIAVTQSDTVQTTCKPGSSSGYQTENFTCVKSNDTAAGDGTIKVKNGDTGPDDDKGDNGSQGSGDSEVYKPCPGDIGCDKMAVREPRYFDVAGTSKTKEEIEGSSQGKIALSIATLQKEVQINKQKDHCTLDDTSGKQEESCSDSTDGSGRIHTLKGENCGQLGGSTRDCSENQIQAQHYDQNLQSYQQSATQAKQKIQLQTEESSLEDKHKHQFEKQTTKRKKKSLMNKVKNIFRLKSNKNERKTETPIQAFNTHDDKQDSRPMEEATCCTSQDEIGWQPPRIFKQFDTVFHVSTPTDEDMSSLDANPTKECLDYPIHSPTAGEKNTFSETPADDPGINEHHHPVPVHHSTPAKATQLHPLPSFQSSFYSCWNTSLLSGDPNTHRWQGVELGQEPMPRLRVEAAFSDAGVNSDRDDLVTMSNRSQSGAAGSSHSLDNDGQIQRCANDSICIPNPNVVKLTQRGSEPDLMFQKIQQQQSNTSNMSGQYHDAMEATPEHLQHLKTNFTGQELQSNSNRSSKLSSSSIDLVTSNTMFEQGGSHARNVHTSKLVNLGHSCYNPDCTVFDVKQTRKSLIVNKQTRIQKSSDSQSTNLSRSREMDNFLVSQRRYEMTAERRYLETRFEPQYSQNGPRYSQNKPQYSQNQHQYSQSGPQYAQSGPQNSQLEPYSSQNGIQQSQSSRLTQHQGSSSNNKNWTSERKAQAPQMTANFNSQEHSFSASQEKGKHHRGDSAKPGSPNSEETQQQRQSFPPSPITNLMNMNNRDHVQEEAVTAFMFSLGNLVKTMTNKTGRQFSLEQTLGVLKDLQRIN